MRKQPPGNQPTGHVVGSFHCSTDGQLRLGVALVKLPLENRKQAGDPVVQTHVQNELQGRTGREKCYKHALHEAKCLNAVKSSDLQNLNDLELGVHDQDVLFLRLSLSLDSSPTGAAV